MKILALAAAVAHAAALDGFQLPKPPSTVHGVAHWEATGNHHDRLAHAGLTHGEISEVLALLREIKSRYPGKLNEDQMITQAIRALDVPTIKGDNAERAMKGLSTAVDRYSTYMTAEEYAAFEKRHGMATEPDFGLWFRKREPGQPFIVDGVTAGSPADTAGIKVGDEIHALRFGDEPAGRHPDLLSNSDLRAIYMPDMNQRLELTIRRYPDRFPVTLLAAGVKTRTVYSRMLGGTVGYAQISGFHGDVVKEFAAALDRLHSQGMRQLIVDLRFNPGGGSEMVKDCLKLIMPGGVVLYFDEGRSRKNVHRTTTDGKYSRLPLVVLVNGWSASSSEIFAAAVQDNRRGRIVGSTTYGKGVGQEVGKWGRGGLRLTTFWWDRPNGGNVNRTGVVPDTAQDLSEKDEQAVENRLHSQIHDKTDPQFDDFDPQIMAAFR